MRRRAVVHAARVLAHSFRSSDPRKYLGATAIRNRIEDLCAAVARLNVGERVWSEERNEALAAMAQGPATQTQALSLSSQPTDRPMGRGAEVDGTQAGTDISTSPLQDQRAEQLELAVDKREEVEGLLRDMAELRQQFEGTAQRAETLTRQARSLQA